MEFIDLHSHLLPGIDDGPSNEAGAVALARAFVDAGTTRVAVTPHVNVRHQNRAAVVTERRAQLVWRLKKEQIPLKLESGAEISTVVTEELSDSELRQLSLGGSDWLLIELPQQGTPLHIRQSIFDVQRRGFKVLLAHPERMPALQQDIDLIADLVGNGTRTQVTAGALIGRFGSTAQKAAQRMFEGGLVHTVASDAHHATERPPGLVYELERSGHKDMIQWLCHDMPAWILDGGEEPPRPKAGTASRRWSLFRR